MRARLEGWFLTWARAHPFSLCKSVREDANPVCLVSDAARRRPLAYHKPETASCKIIVRRHESGMLRCWDAGADRRVAEKTKKPERACRDNIIGAKLVYHS